MIEDEPAFSELVTRYFGQEGFAVTVASTGREGLDLLERAEPRAVLLDLRLPDMDGFEVCKLIRRQSNIPIVILSSKTEEVDKIAGLELGADDYATKPFSPAELLARVKAVLRRAGDRPITERTVTLGPYSIDGAARRVNVHLKEIELTPTEFDLLWHLVRTIGVAQTRDDLFREVWGASYRGRSRTVDAHISSLRSKMPELAITSVRGVGYRLDG